MNFAAQPILRTIGRVIGADVLADAMEFFRAFEGIEAGFRERARQVDALLRSDATRYVVVTAPRADTVAEAHDFVETLRAADRPVSAVIINRLLPVFSTMTATAAEKNAVQARADGRGEEAALWDNLCHLRRLADAEAATVKPLVKLVKGVPVARIAQRATDVHDLDAVMLVADDLSVA